MVWLWCKWQVSSWFYGLIVAKVTSAFLVLWFDCGASHKYFLGFVWFDFCASNKLWFDCGASHKRVLIFMVWLLRKSQARSWFYGLIVAHLTSAFLGFMVWLWCKSQVRSWFYGLIVAQFTSAFWFLWFDCGLSHKRVLGFMVWLWCKSQAHSWFYCLIVA